MTQYSTSDLSRKSGDIIAEALRRPVTITQRNKPRLVLLSIEDFRRLTARANTRAAGRLEDMPDDLFEGVKEAVSAYEQESDGVREPLRKALEPYADRIKAAFVYGSFAKGTDGVHSDVDLMVIGDDLNYSDLYTAIRNAEDRLLRKINPTFLSTKEWRRRSSQGGSFIKKLSAGPKMVVLGSERDLRS
jgi:prevent-host-death family protein